MGDRALRIRAMLSWRPHFVMVMLLLAVKEDVRGMRLPEADEVEYVLERPELMTGPSAEIWPTLYDEGFVEVFSKEGVVLLKRVESPGGPGGSKPSGVPIRLIPKSQRLDSSRLLGC